MTNYLHLFLGMREKRIVPLIPIAIVGAAFLFGGFIMYLKVNADIRQDIERAERNMEKMLEAIRDVSKELFEEQQINMIKFELEAYIRNYKHALLKFIKLISQNKVIPLTDVPLVIKKYFNATFNNEKFYTLKLGECDFSSVTVEITVSQSDKLEKIECHQYIHVGSIEASVFSKYLMENLLCYKNGKCLQVKAENCVNVLVR